MQGVQAVTHGGEADPFPGAEGRVVLGGPGRPVLPQIPAAVAECRVNGQPDPGPVVMGEIAVADLAGRLRSQRA